MENKKERQENRRKWIDKYQKILWQWIEECFANNTCYKCSYRAECEGVWNKVKY